MDNFLVSYTPVQVTDYSTYELPEQKDTIQFIDTQPISKGFTGYPNYQQINNNLANMSFEDLVKKYNLPIKITSGYRDKFRGGKTKSGKQSNHNKTDEYGNPMAYDIQPLINGKVDKSNSAFAYLRSILSNNQTVREWFKLRNWGILDETTPQIMAKTGATGKHFHIGPDSAAVKFT